MNPFDIPSTVTAMINKAIEIELIDINTVLALGAKYGEDYDGIVKELVAYAYSNIHINDDHNIIVPFSDSYYHLKQIANRMTHVNEIEIPTEDLNDFDTRFNVFFLGCIDINHEYMSHSFPNQKKDEFSFKKGRRYMKVIRDGSVHCFVDTKNGDVLKAASWSAPAKHARGNIFDTKNGLSWMGEYGPAYLR